MSPLVFLNNPLANVYSLVFGGGYSIVVIVYRCTVLYRYKGLLDLGVPKNFTFGNDTVDSEFNVNDTATLYVSIYDILFSLSTLVVLVLSVVYPLAYYRRKRVNYMNHVKRLLVDGVMDDEKANEGSPLIVVKESSSDEEIEKMDDEESFEEKESINNNVEDEILDTLNEDVEQIAKKSIGQKIIEFIKIYFLLMVTNIKKQIPKGKDKLKFLKWRSDFFYPQRLLTGLGVGFLFSLYVILVNWASYFIIMGLMRIGFAFVIDLCANMQQPIIPQFPFIKCPFHQNTVAKFFDIVSTYIFVNLIVSVILTIGFILFSIMLMMFQYKINMLRLRKGDYFFEAKKYNIFNASQYIGYQISHTCIQCFVLYNILILILNICGGVGLSMYFFPSAKNWVIDNILIKLIIMGAILFFFRYLFFWFVKFIFVNKGFYRFTCLFPYVDFFVIIYSAFSGILLALPMRLIKPAISKIIFFMRLDTTTYSHKHYNDSDYHSYIAMLLSDHRHNHPVASTAIRLIVKKKSNTSLIGKKLLWAFVVNKYSLREKEEKGEKGEKEEKS